MCIPGILSHRSPENPSWFQALHGFTLNSKFWGVAAPHSIPAPLPADINPNLHQIHKTNKILTLLCLQPDFFLSLEAGSAFPTQIKAGSDEFSCLRRCLPQIPCPPFTSPHDHTLSAQTLMFLFSSPFNSRSFPLDFHSSEITGTRCCFLVFLSISKLLLNCDLAYQDFA